MEGRLKWIGCLMLLVACEASALTLGQTRRSDEAYYDSAPCRNLKVPARFKKIAAYLNALADYLRSQNRQTFEGVPPTCIDVDEFWEDPGVAHAQAFPEERRILMTPELILEAKNDAEVAATLSHELAHVSLQHHEATLGDKRSPWWHLHEEWLVLRRKGWGELDFDKRVEMIYAREKLTEEIQNKQRRVYAAEYLTRWAEQEADEAGFELYLRAGFPTDNFSWRQEQSALEEELGMRTYSARDLGSGKILEKCKGGEPRPPYIRPGVEDYPSDCWRIWNVRERLSDYRAELERPRKIPALSPSLEEAQNSL